AVCGFGRIGKRHAKIISEYDGCTVQGIIDINAEVMTEAVELGYHCDVFIELDQFIEYDKGRTDVITIAVPNALHAPLAIKALKGGYHVVIEKPMALSK